MHRNWKFITGIALISLSTLLFLSLLGVPFLSVDAKAKITISTILIVLGEVTFWVGGILLGKQLFNKYKAYLNPSTWFTKKKVDSNTIEEKEGTIG
jgi:hypothetical protein